MENLFAPPPLGPELASGKWKVHIYMGILQKKMSQESKCGEYQENENSGNIKLASALEVLLEACRDIQFHENENENGGNINHATAINNVLHQVYQVTRQDEVCITEATI
ncbi:uncharacterized protein LOC9313173 isoform X1 [Arabidopsis lyrata subsp. lyrata]|nr:uncharacterized protein LOC9313173 isoform X1 [Arabidopsis lyrata subsp. lyrata]XP_020879612.1 uncharacterized protein LOC9313173 isoform X1 [Arabidopsis lyrata subsp. lyrata]XP_020879613.1 uncharacterized protein LOC9313173 isoform X1 [Arabidopsis lyrata subsp. lyrata]XP_020879614.1 uncharacterized protein LOC9313173 isoform X1 [Arabidopsis lyrata subsp. lyrata]|eukprot:XP_020879611.1 uncharacterized protein LOC9313173 isoform X1 [Arabidopsis lyrata subsp. lyrata]